MKLKSPILNEINLYCQIQRVSHDNHMLLYLKRILSPSNQTQYLQIMTMSQHIRNNNIMWVKKRKVGYSPS